MTDTLAPCPFCGASKAMMFEPTCRPETPYNPADRLFPIVRCMSCLCEVAGANEDYRGHTAIAAWNRRHPPASREEGLREAAEVARKNFHTMQLAANSLRIERDQAREALRTIIAADDDFRASMAPGTEKDPVTLACDRARALIPTKPEAKEPSLSERVTELENALRPFAELADVFAATGADKIGGRDIGKALNAARAALQSKKPE